MDSLPTNPDRDVAVTPPPARRRLVRNLGSLSAASAITKLLVFATSLGVSRLLGPTEVGRLVTAQTMVMIGSLFADLGLTVLTLGDIVREPERISELVSATALLQVVAAGFMSVILAGLALLAPLPFGTSSLLLLILPLPLALALNTAYALQSVEDMGRVAACRLVSQVVTSAGSIALLLVDRSPTWPAVMAWVGVAAADVLAMVWLWHRHGVRPVRSSVTALVALARRAVPILQNAVLLILLYIADTLSLAAFSTAHEVGIYSIGWSMAFAAQSVVILVTDAAYPELVRRWGAAVVQVRQLTDQLTNLLGRLTFVGTALVVVEAPALVRLALGSSYAGTAAVLRVLVWIVPVGAIAVLLSFVLLSAEEAPPSHLRHRRHARPASPRAVLVRRRGIAVLVAVVGCPIAADGGGAVPVAAVILAATTVELILLTAATGRLAAARPVAALAHQLDYLAVPLLALLALHAALPGAQLYLSVPLWVGAALAVEGRRRFPTLRELVGAYRPAQPGLVDDAPGKW